MYELSFPTQPKMYLQHVRVSASLLILLNMIEPGAGVLRNEEFGAGGFLVEELEAVGWGHGQDDGQGYEVAGLLGHDSAVSEEEPLQPTEDGAFAGAPTALTTPGITRLELYIKRKK